MPKDCSCGAKLRSDNKSGLCVPCGAKRWREANRERLREQERQRYLADPERYKAQSRAWYAANPDKARAIHREWRQANPDKARATPDQNSADKAARQALKRKLFVEVVYRSVVWRRDGGVCHLCLQPADPARWDLDHVISLFDGGPHCYANTAVSHPVCNMEKAASSRSLCGVRWAEATGAYKQFHDKEYK